MCCSVFPCLCLVEVLSLSPLLLALLMPLYGSLFGVASVLRMSLILYCYVICNSLLSRRLGVIGPCMSGIAFAIVSTVHFVVMPTPALWLYEMSLWLTEPVLQVVEVLMIVTLTTKTSTWIMEVDEEHSPIGKIAVLVGSMTSYTIMPFLLVLFALQAGDLFWLVYVVGGVYLLATVATLCKDEGIILDSAIVCLASSMALTIALWEQNCAKSVLEIPTQYEVASTDDQSLLEIILSMPQRSLEFANQPIELFRKIFSLPFWFIATLRVLSAIWLVIWWQCRKTVVDDEFYDSDTDDERGPLTLMLSKCPKMNSSLLILLAAIFVYTQIVVVHLGYTSASASLVMMPAGISRFVQCFGLIGVYFWMLMRRSEEDKWDYSM